VDSHTAVIIEHIAVLVHWMLVQMSLEIVFPLGSSKAQIDEVCCENFSFKSVVIYLLTYCGGECGLLIFSVSSVCLCLSVVFEF